MREKGGERWKKRDSRRVREREREKGRETVSARVFKRERVNWGRIETECNCVYV